MWMVVFVELLQDPNTTIYSCSLGTDADSMIITRLGGGREDERETQKRHGTVGRTGAL